MAWPSHVARRTGLRRGDALRRPRPLRLDELHRPVRECHDAPHFRRRFHSVAWSKRAHLDAPVWRDELLHAPLDHARRVHAPLEAKCGL